MDIDYKKIYDYLYDWKITYTVGGNIDNFLNGFIGNLRERRKKLIRMILILKFIKLNTVKKK